MSEDQALRPGEHDEPTAAGQTGRVILLCCGVVYAVLCIPAIGARGYPPIDPAWFAVTFLWVAAIPLSMVFDASPFQTRFRGLAIYCLVTAFFDAGTGGGIVPRHVTLPIMLVMTVVYGPLHLVVGMLVEGLSQGIRGVARSIFRRIEAGNTRFVQQATFIVLVLLTCAFPFAFRTYSIMDTRHRGRMQAEEDWNAGRAELRVEYFDRWGPVTHRFDPATGLKIRERGHMSEYSLAYNVRVAELLAEHGIPGWSMKKHLPADDDLIAMLHSQQMEEIDAFPHEVNENIILIRHGTISRWNTMFSNLSGFLAVATPQGLIGVGMSGGSSSSNSGHSSITLFGSSDHHTDVPEEAPVFIGRLPEYPQIVFVRSGTDWVGAFHENGEWLSSAGRASSSGGSMWER